MSEIVTYLNDISETKEQGKNFWSRWLDRFAAYYDEKFGPDLKDKEKNSWEKFQYDI
jgi:hypothetical protein